MMGKYIDKGNMGFREARNSEYVDKSGLIAVVNGLLGTKFKFSCVSRARRFGKSMAAEMLMAYYDRSCDSRKLFLDLEIANSPSFEEHLNKYPVIYLDFSAFATSFHKPDIVNMIDTELKKDVRNAYPDVPLPRGADLMAYLKRVNDKKGDRFFFIIDEWDALLREVPGAVTDDYVNWLRHMFKDVSASDVFLGVYMTGILPIKKYDTQSALNNFTEYSMVKPGAFAKYFGFTKDEVRALAKKHGMDFDEHECYLPNREVAIEMENALDTNNWKPVVDALKQSERLLQDLLRGNAEAVARGVEDIHRQEISLFQYNDENSMACVISLAFYAARNDFHVHREYQTGDGYADLVLIPRKNVSKPAVVIELKYDKTVITAISQIKQKHYPEKILEYTGNILLAGITYDRETKQHTCRIEPFVKE